MGGSVSWYCTEVRGYEASQYGTGNSGQWDTGVVLNLYTVKKGEYKLVCLWPIEYIWYRYKQVKYKSSYNCTKCIQ